MTDEEAREDIKTGHGFISWLAENLLAVYERYRVRELSPSKALEQTILCYMATHAAANYDVETGLFSEVQWGES